MGKLLLDWDLCLLSVSKWGMLFKYVHYYTMEPGLVLAHMNTKCIKLSEGRLIEGRVYISFQKHFLRSGILQFSKPAIN